MRFDRFTQRAHEIFDEIPPDYREGVDGIDVTRETVSHPTLPEVYTLGECLSEFYPSEYGGAGEIRSRVVLYYGSFLALSRTRDDWDWEGELHETVLHEVRHHLEHLAAEDELDEMDYAEDQNFARREGESFDPFFYQRGRVLAASVYEVDGDVFIERPLRPADAGRTLDLEWQGRPLRVPVPEHPADVHFLIVVGLDPGIRSDGEEGGELNVVLVRKRGFFGWLKALLGDRVTVGEEEVEL